MSSSSSTSTSSETPLTQHSQLLDDVNDAKDFWETDEDVTKRKNSALVFAPTGKGLKKHDLRSLVTKSNAKWVEKIDGTVTHLIWAGSGKLSQQAAQAQNRGVFIVTSKAAAKLLEPIRLKRTRSEHEREENLKRQRLLQDQQTNELNRIRAAVDKINKICSNVLSAALVNHAECQKELPEPADMNFLRTRQLQLIKFQRQQLHLLSYQRHIRTDKLTEFEERIAQAGQDDESSSILDPLRATLAQLDRELPQFENFQFQAKQVQLETQFQVQRPQPNETLLHPFQDLGDFLTPLVMIARNRIETRSPLVTRLPKPDGLHLLSEFPIATEPKDEFVVFHRQCYPALFRSLQSALMIPGTPKLVITGTPGIGKSHSFFSLLPHLLMDNRIVAHQSAVDQLAMFFLDNDYKIKGYRADIKSIPLKTWLSTGLRERMVIFRDYETDFSPASLRLPGVEVLLSSPRRVGFSDFLKGMKTEQKFIIPPFSKLELRQFGSALLLPDQKIRNALALYDWFGGVPRFCFELAEDPDSWEIFFNHVKAREAEPIIKLVMEKPPLQALSMAQQKENYPHRLLFIHNKGFQPDSSSIDQVMAQRMSFFFLDDPRDNEQQAFGFGQFNFSSPVIADLLESSMLFANESHQAMQSSVAVELFGGAAFERLCTQFLTSKFLAAIVAPQAIPVKIGDWVLKTRQAKDGSSQEYYGLEWKTSTERFALPHREQPVQMESSPTEWTHADKVLVRCGNQSTWDALSTDGLFNYTISRNGHSCLKAGLDDAVRILKCADIPSLPNFYWLVTNHTWENPSTFHIDHTDHAMSLKHRLIACPNLTPKLLVSLRESLIQDQLKEKAADLTKNCSPNLKKIIDAVLNAHINNVRCPTVEELQLQDEPSTVAPSRLCAGPGCRDIGIEPCESCAVPLCSFRCYRLHNDYAHTASSSNAN